MHVLDRVGTVASAICAVHCLITGVALGLLSYVGLGFFGSVTTDLVFLGVAVLVGAVAIRHGVSKHHSYKPALIFVLGLVLIGVGHYGFSHSHDAGESRNVFGTIFSILGGLCFVGFHIANFLLQRKCNCNHCSTGA
jgi:hypothetical protein